VFCGHGYSIRRTGQPQVPSVDNTRRTQVDGSLLIGAVIAQVVPPTVLSRRFVLDVRNDDGTSRSMHMLVKIIATRQCNHRPSLERELRDIGIDYELVFVEDAPDIVERYHIRHSPNILVDGEVVFRCQPSEGELKRYFDARSS
jgi:glutaredoxin